MLTHRVIKFYKIVFDPNWQLLSTTRQLFTYGSKKGGKITVNYEAPQGTVFTVFLACKEGTKAIVHRDVLHVRADAKISKGDSLKD